jgi:hypothetical protein
MTIIMDKQGIVIDYLHNRMQFVSGAMVDLTGADVLR